MAWLGLISSEPVGQSHFGDNVHASRARLSSRLDFGENTVVGWGGGETIWTSYDFWECYLQIQLLGREIARQYVETYILYEAGFGLGEIGWVG